MIGSYISYLSKNEFPEERFCFICHRQDNAKGIKTSKRAGLKEVRKVIEERMAEPAGDDARARLAWMDASGLSANIIYPGAGLVAYAPEPRNGASLDAETRAAVEGAAEDEGFGVVRDAVAGSLLKERQREQVLLKEMLLPEWAQSVGCVCVGEVKVGEHSRW